jgi:hypothetical protein
MGNTEVDVPNLFIEFWERLAALGKDPGKQAPSNILEGGKIKGSV